MPITKAEIGREYIWCTTIMVIVLGGWAILEGNEFAKSIGAAYIIGVVMIPFNMFVSRLLFRIFENAKT